MPRTINGNFVDYHLDYVKLMETKVAYNWHKWSALSVIASVLKRHVHVMVKEWPRPVFPNLYTVLVGRPGLGKGIAMDTAIDLLTASRSSNVQSGKLTMPFIVELMAKGFTHAQTAGSSSASITTDHSVSIYSSELSVFFNAYKDTIEILTDLWDSKDVFTTGGIMRGGKIVPKPSLNLLGGSAQEWLVKAIPHDAIGGGFTRRVNFVYADRKEQPGNSPGGPSSNGSNVNQRISDMRNNLVSTLQHVGSLKGAFHFDGAVLPMFEAYKTASEPDEFDDAATAGYITSKPAHALKLAMCLSAARSDSMVIEACDFTNAMILVDEVQESIKIVFRSVGTNTLVEAGDKLLRFLEARGSATEQQILAAMWRDISRHDLAILLETFYAAGVMVSQNVGRHIVWKLAYNPNQKPKGVKTP